MSHGAHCTFADTAAFAFSVNVQLGRLLPLLEQAPDQLASRPFETVNVIDVPAANGAEPVLPTPTLMPAGADVIRSPLRPLAVTVSVALPLGGGVEPCGVKLRTDDHAPAVPALFRPRTRHQCCRLAAVVTVCCDALTTWSTTNGDANVLESSTCT